MRDAEVEGAADDRAARVQRAVVSEVLPEPERDGGELQAAAARSAIGHPLVAEVCRDVGHSELPFVRLRRMSLELREIIGDLKPRCLGADEDVCRGPDAGRIHERPQRNMDVGAIPHDREEQ